MGFMAHAEPAGSGSPFARAVSTPKSATAAVAMSRMSGCSLVGIAKHIGLVPKTGRAPAAGGAVGALAVLACVAAVCCRRARPKVVVGRYEPI